jgi:signal transduction histidine kinase
MMMKSFKTFMGKYFGPGLDLHVQVFNLLGFAGAAAGIIVAVVSAAQNAGAVTVGLNLSSSALAAALLRTAGKKISYRAAGWVIVIAVFMIAFPALFFSMGGYRSGMPCFFIFAIIFTAILFEKYERIAVLSVEFALYAGCCLVAFFYPETVHDFQDEIDYVSDVITGIVVSGVLLLLVVLLHIRMYHVREMQIEELNRELEARNETLIKYDKMKSGFLATVAHEISTPLTAIMGSSADTMELLKESPVNMDEIMGNHERIEKKVMLIDGIVTDLMDTVAIENGRLSLSRRLVKLSGLLQSVCDKGPKRSNARNNRVVLDFIGKLPPLWADPARIEQVMTNLLSNADRHTKDGLITVTLARTGKGQTVSVADSGEGMEPEIAEAALKEYVTSRAENWRHGYGLYICRQIILSHGGAIWIESERGRGTTVSFTLAEERDD